MEVMVREVLLYFLVTSCYLHSYFDHEVGSTSYTYGNLSVVFSFCLILLCINDKTNSIQT